jgi:YidC/Oxa1 family membrane protein insertase
MQQRNFLLFIALSVLIFITWTDIQRRFWPPLEPPAKKETAKSAEKEPEKEGEKGEPKKAPEKKAAEATKPPPSPPVEAAPVTPPDKLITLGSRKSDSKFQLGVDLDPPRGAVRSIVLNKFQAEDPTRPGQPGWLDAEKKIPRLLELVPASANYESPSFLLYAFDVKDPDNNRPLDTLGRGGWKTLGDKQVETRDGRVRESISFQAESQGVLITKTYSVTEGDYHLGLEVKLTRKADAGSKAVQFRYQMTGAHGLPIEGRWYTSIFRNAMIAQADIGNNGNVARDLQALQQIGIKEGGDPVLREPGRLIRWAGVAVQYFASVIAVSDDQEKQDFVKQARPTLETAVTKGVVKNVAENGSSFVLMTPDKKTVTFQVPQSDWLLFRNLKPDFHIAVIHHSGPFDERLGECPEIATFFQDEDSAHAAWIDDITVRVTTEAVSLQPGEEVVHKYLLYNGPVKVSQLYDHAGLESVPADLRAVPNDLVARYHDKLCLNTLTDYHSPGMMGQFASSIYWTNLIIKCTNIMHAVLSWIHGVIPNYGVCILVLTILVRGLMFPISRKQALTSIRMQQLVPELKKLQEKHKDDRQALGVAQMELYRKHGVNPFGSCWFLLLQMPIFMGLYFALQESIHFRLAEFWPTWINNLAAPDMLIRWGENIPWLSRPQDYGGFLYLGPYFNLLPVIAVALMIAQQKMMTPPPTDEQQAMQQKMMKYMMIFFGLMFYKVAAGLCLYFIASSLWGFAERKLLPRRQVAGLPTAGETSADGLLLRMLRRSGETPATAGSTAVTAPGRVAAQPGEARARSRGRNRNRRRERGREETRGGAPAAEEPVDGSPLGKLRSWWRERRERLRDWWEDVLEQARKK